MFRKQIIASRYNAKLEVVGEISVTATAAAVLSQTQSTIKFRLAVTTKNEKLTRFLKMFYNRRKVNVLSFLR